jgi:hypothetical protein
MSKKPGIESASALELAKHKSSVEPMLAAACENLTTEKVLSRLQAKT